MIAEFVRQDPYRPSYYLQRPSKILARMSWSIGEYTSLFQTPDEMMAYLRTHPVNLVIWHERSGVALMPHERILNEVLRDNPRFRTRVPFPGSAGGASSTFTVYEYRPLEETRRAGLPSVP